MKYLTLLLLFPLVLHSSDMSKFKIEKDIDNVKRKQYYKECKVVQRTGCHTESFNKSIVYKFVGELK